jgi:hypothetical protein
MIITRFNLLGADGNFKIVTFEGKHDEPFKFIKTTEYSDYKVVGHDILDLGKFESTPEKILKDIQRFSSVHITGKVDEDRMSNDEDWDYLFFEVIVNSVEEFENYLKNKVE